MALDRLLPVSGTPGAVTGNNYMDAVAEEVTGLWDRSMIRLTSVSGTNTITATFVPALTAGLLDGMNAVLRAVATNTTSVTLNGVAVVDAEGNGLTAGALRINAVYHLHYVSAISSWVVVGYIPAAAVNSGMKFIKTLVAANSSSLDFVNGVAGVVFDNTYDSYILEFSTLAPANDDVELWLRVGTGGGPTYQATNYRWSGHVTNDGGGSGVFNSSSSAQISLSLNTGASNAVGNAAGENISGRVYIPNPDSTDYHTMTYEMCYIASSIALQRGTGGASWTQGTAITAVRLLFESGNIASGRATLYGLAKA